MNCKTEEEILKTREEAVRKVEDQYRRKVEVLNSYFTDYDPKTGSVPLKYLAKSLEALADADLAYFCKGFDKARGCWIEYECAKAYGIETMVSIVGG